jgi:uncharacterized protein (DUF952 family)
MTSGITNDDDVIYKIARHAEWRDAVTRGRYHGSADDMRDGFIHFSTASQLEGTARKHFSGQRDLLLIAIRASVLGAALRWEPSRGGALFPHLYAALDPSAALWSRPLALDSEGVPAVAAALGA